MSPSQRRRTGCHGPRARLAGLLAVAIVALGLVPTGSSRAEEPPAPPADAELLKLVPADSALILTIDGFRDRSRAILESRIVGELRRLPAFAAWLDSADVRGFLASRKGIEDFLQTSFREIGDEIFGDAVALALRSPTDSPADAQGLLVLRARDSKLLNRLIDQINATQKTNGELAAIAEHARGDSKYFTRKYPEGSGRPDESYVVFADGVFALSNAESLVQWVIDRKATPGSDSVADRGGFQKVASRLPKTAAARLFASAGLARWVVAGMPRDDSPAGRKVMAAINDYAGAIEYVGAALVVDDSAITIQTAQAFDPAKFPGLTDWWTATTTPEKAGPGPRLDSIPPSALALAMVNVDVPALYRTLAALVPEADRPKLEQAEVVANGLLLGLDARTRVLPALGPRIVAYVEAPSDDPAEPKFRGLPLPLVVATEIREAPNGGGAAAAPTVAAALDNALRVVLATVALEDARVAAKGGRVETNNIVTALSVPYPFAFAVDRPGRRLALGSSAAAVARYLEADVDPDAGSRFRKLRDAAFPGYESFICLDLAAIHDLAAKHKDRLIALAAQRRDRPAESVARDFDQVMALVRLFDAAFAAGRVDPAAALVDSSLGLIPRPAAGEAETATKP